MRKVHLWKGYHGVKIRDLIARVWSRDDELLILCPPQIDPTPFLHFLPPTERLWHGELQPGLVSEPLAPVVYPSVPVLGLFTSGTTSGKPELVLYSKANIRSSLAAILKILNVQGIDSVFCYPQPFHTFGLLLGYILALEEGWPLLTGEGRYSGAHHEQRRRATQPGLMTLGTPTHFEDLKCYVQMNGEELAPSLTCIVGGAKVTVSLWERLREQLKIALPSIGYGATQASPGVAHLPAGHAPVEDGEIGFPLPGLVINLIPGRGYELRGPSVCLAVITASGIEFPQKILISDELSRRADGVLIFNGRSDFVLNRGGEKFSLEAIEAVLLQHGIVALAFSLSDPRLGQDLALLVEEGPSPETILQVLQQKFLTRFSSSLIRFNPRLPVNSNCKLDRQAGQALLGCI